MNFAHAGPYQGMVPCVGLDFIITVGPNYAFMQNYILLWHTRRYYQCLTQRFKNISTLVLAYVPMANKLESAAQAHDVLVNSAIMKGECTKQQDKLPKCIRAGRIARIADAASPAWASSRRSLRYAPVKSDATLTSNYSAIGTTPNGEPGVRLNVRMYVASTKYPLLVLDCLFNPMKPIGWPGGQQNSLKQLMSLPEPNWISRPHCNGPILIFY